VTPRGVGDGKAGGGKEDHLYRSIGVFFPKQGEGGLEAKKNIAIAEGKH